MNKKTIENILRFLERTELKWNEVPAFVWCINELTSLLREQEDVWKTSEEPK